MAATWAVMSVGNSNSLTRGAAANSGLHASLQGAQTNCKFWTGSAFASLQPNVANDYPTQTTNGGHIFALAKGLQAYAGNTIYLCGYGIGGSPLYNDGSSDVWDSSVKGNCWSKAISTFNNMLANLWNTVGIREYKFLLNIRVGETDTTSATYYGDTNGSNTNALMTALINAWRANLNGTAFASAKKYVIINNIGTDQDYDPTGRAAVRQGIINCAAGLSDCYVYDSTGCELQVVDFHHYTCPGYKTMGEGDVTIITSNNL